MNLVDLVILAGVAISAYWGWHSGFLATVLALVTWLLGLVLAVAAHATAAAVLVALTGMAPPVARAISFVVILFVAEAAFALLARAALEPLLLHVRADRTTRLVDRAAGVVPGVGLALAFAAAAIAVLLSVVPETREPIDRSRIGSALAAEVGALKPRLTQLLGSERESFEVLLVTRLSADERQSLDLPDDLRLSSDPDAERQMFELVNQERTSSGLKPVELDPRLVPVARAHAEEMFRLKYFGHVSPVTGTPFDRLARAGIRYQRSGENLAYAQSVAVAHRGLMESPGHRENILRPEFTHLGVGVVNAGLYGRMFVQLLLTP